MRVIFKIIGMVLFLGFSVSIAQEKKAQPVTADSLSHRTFRFSLEPQQGYTFIFGVNGGISNAKSPRMAQAFGIAYTSKSPGGHEGPVISDRYVLMEINEINNKTYYSAIAGLYARGLMGAGISAIYLWGPNNAEMFSIRPTLGIALIPPFGSGYVEFSCDVSILPPNFNLHEHWLIGIRYEIGFLAVR